MSKITTILFKNFYLKISPSCRASEAIPSNTEPVPFSVPLTVPHEKSMKLEIKIITRLVFISKDSIIYYT